ncbi:Zinc/iron permease [Dacryopinax primogenitus]|uniref:Zinc/iron permease n=1 Tax=Dacryopinax primogenitus (strain DJM 731) TaxID=1858805 RepID=M5GE91_DACPD|nr:Zinc/iron permease [Dacryopinax primogenitus]EJU03088.1 Zinc/iron permease [Dacryopinax primogenitus]
MGFTALFLMSAVMGVTSFAVGSLPLTLTFSHSRLKMLTTYGMGLLLGAALAVIIPEGIETLYSSLPAAGERTDSNPFSQPGRVVAVSLVLGFSVMLFVEQLSSHSKNSGSSTYEMASPGGTLHQHAHESHSKAFSATLALVIHSFADGIALGSSSLGDNSGLELVVFLAIMVHKAPASLGLCTTLLSYSEPRPRIKQYLFAFSAAAPIGALVTYGVVWGLGNAAANLQWWAGVALLFSGGTFLYVATVIQDVSGHSHAPEVEEATPTEELSVSTRLTLLVTGMLTPLVMSTLVGHKH